jgi:phosphoribosylaminoimidazole carboxylase PurE protein
MGSDSDLEVMKIAAEVLSDFGVGYELVISSAHRTPAKTEKYTKEAPARGIKVLIAGAGYAAHLAGVIAANTVLPVIGVPLNASSLGGMDSLLSMVQMPSGIPVATVTIGKAGAKNAALLALQMLALSDKDLSGKLVEYREVMAKKVEEKDKNLKS